MQFSAEAKKTTQNSCMSNLDMRLRECLLHYKGKIFSLDEQTNKWSIIQTEKTNSNNTIVNQELKKESKLKTEQHQEKRLRDEQENEHEDTIDILADCLDSVIKSPKLKDLISKNPFKKTMKLKKTSEKNKRSFKEELLAEFLAGDWVTNQERLIGMMQFYS